MPHNSARQYPDSCPWPFDVWRPCDINEDYHTASSVTFQTKTIRWVDVQFNFQCSGQPQEVYCAVTKDQFDQAMSTITASTHPPTWIDERRMSLPVDLPSAASDTIVHGLERSSRRTSECQFLEPGDLLLSAKSGSKDHLDISVAFVVQDGLMLNSTRNATSWESRTRRIEGADISTPEVDIVQIPRPGESVVAFYLRVILSTVPVAKSSYSAGCMWISKSSNHLVAVLMAS
jgi:hypothetical protein